MRLILGKLLHVWRIDYCLAGKEERFQLPKRSYQGGASLVCVMDYLMTLVTKARVALRVWMTLLFSWESSQIDEGWNFLEFPFKKCCWVHTNNVFVLHGRCQKFSKPWLGTKDFSRFSKSIFHITIDVKKPRKLTLTKMRKSKLEVGYQPGGLITHRLSRLATFELKRTMLSLRLSLVLMVLGLAASVQSDETTSTPVMMENSDSPG